MTLGAYKLKFFQQRLKFSQIDFFLKSFYFVLCVLATRFCSCRDSDPKIRTGSGVKDRVKSELTEEPEHPALQRSLIRRWV